jgi:hypothetical protein
MLLFEPFLATKNQGKKNIGLNLLFLFVVCVTNHHCLDKDDDKKDNIGICFHHLQQNKPNFF